MTPSPPVLPAAALHGPVGEFVKRLEPHTEADPAAILIQALVGFGNLIGRTAHFVVEADEHYCVLNAVLVGDTSKARKGVSWRRVQSILTKVDPMWPMPAGGLSSGEGLIYAVRDGVTMDEISTDPNAPPADMGASDKRLLVIEEEFGRPLKVGTRKENILFTVVRLAFDTGNLRVLTRNSPLKATGAHISIIGHITRLELLHLLTDIDCINGFANRLLWPYVRRSKELPDGGQSHLLDFSDIEAKLKQAREFARTCGELRRDPEADELWKTEYSRLSRGMPGKLGGVTSRGEAYAMRLATVYAVLDRTQSIRVSHLQAAFAVWGYCADSARFIFGDALGDSNADAVLTALRAAGAKGMTRTDINRLVFKGNKPADQIERALELLSYHYLAEKRIIATEGRSTETWFIT